MYLIVRIRDDKRWYDDRPSRYITSLTHANVEAARLARQHPNVKFAVVEVKTVWKASAPEAHIVENYLRGE